MVYETWSGMHMFQCTLILALIPIALFGIVSNIVTISIYFQPKTLSSINVLISGLALWDALVLITGVFCFIPFGLQYTFRVHSCFLLSFNAYITNYAYPFALMCQTSGMYILVLITIERFVAVCRPLQAMSFCTVRRAEMWMCMIVLASMCFNAPRLFEYKILSGIVEMNETDNSTSNCSASWAVESLRGNYHYSVAYTLLLNMSFMFIIPFAILLTLNYRIARALHHSFKYRQNVKTTEKRQKKTTFMMFLVTLIFLFCNLPAFIMAILELIYFFKTSVKKPPWFFVATDVNNLLVMFSSAVNPIIYFCLSQRYKTQLQQRLRVCPCVNGSEPRYRPTDTGYTVEIPSDLRSTDV